MRFRVSTRALTRAWRFMFEIECESREDVMGRLGYSSDEVRDVTREEDAAGERYLAVPGLQIKVENS